MARLNQHAIRLSRLLCDLSVCETCKLPTIVVNGALVRGARGTVPVDVSPETHCACPPSDERCAGPAWRDPALVKTDADFLKLVTE